MQAQRITTTLGTLAHRCECCGQSIHHGTEHCIVGHSYLHIECAALMLGDLQQRVRLGLDWGRSLAAVQREIAHFDGLFC